MQLTCKVMLKEYHFPFVFVVALLFLGLMQPWLTLIFFLNIAKRMTLNFQFPSPHLLSAKITSR